MGEESLSDPPLPKRVTGDVNNCQMKPDIVEGVQNLGMPVDGLHHQHHSGQGMHPSSHFSLFVQKFKSVSEELQNMRFQVLTVGQPRMQVLWDVTLSLGDPLEHQEPFT
jgi:hypothetical protein